ncbi:MAG: N-6 DNA methylase [Bacteroidota bacterium]|nr:N-6 DNA methylase [Bacteroidota bacterium]MXW15644.1 N-6 DNA methylase [Rhodothermaceae bacterium]MDE2644398.1 N-6 DNA methylase [Bacteroidota bacterium]MXW32766.1 N-6 DNA methylase [Rhodothermaceae bacterium]MYC04874.1 N-6 DNA methylase [Rhodothermaceae bacterium]
MRAENAELYEANTGLHCVATIPVASDQSDSFSQYVESILELAELCKPVNGFEWQKKLALCLDGEPGRILREQIPRIDLRRQGAYFTSFRLAKRVAAAAVSQTITPKVCDPACGAGDLLLAVARKLPLQPNFQDTLGEWGRLLSGFDISGQFVRLTKARLILLAAKRHKIRPPFDSSLPLDPFPNIKIGNSLTPLRHMSNIDVTIMNPPFGYATAPADCDWASGRVNAAALFVDRVIRDTPKGSRIVAILPDVLRSGSRYVTWRELTRVSGSVLCEKPLGLFDKWTDVDVYLFHFEKGLNLDKYCVGYPPDQATYGVGKRFSVHVGPVVPHRHAETGPYAPYINARSLPSWGELTTIKTKRQFTGPLFEPPFVCVKRTSRPDSGHRAIATLVRSNKPVAVENHLVVLLPKDGKIQTCRKLMCRLVSPKTDRWLNARLRCRHLTTSAISEMPWWYKP